MAATFDLKRLNAAIDTTPIIDNHAHPLLKLEYMGKHPLLSIATEANGDALDDTWSSLAHVRAVKQLAGLLGCEQTWNAVATAIDLKRAESPDAWVRQCLEGIETILVDDGLDMPDQVENYSWHDSFTKSKCKRIVRVEAVAEDIIGRHCNTASNAEGESHLQGVLQEFREAIERSIADPEVVGFKSIICYRGGLDIISREDLGIDGSKEALRAIMKAHLSGERPFHLHKKLQHTPLNHLIVHMTAQFISEDRAVHKKPIQFHTGLGDNDITLMKSSPSHLQTFIRQYPTVPIVILHASYPWTREAGYLAAMYSNVYADIGEVFPFLNRQGQEGVVRQILELCPWSKILWSTDGHWFPETYVLATVQVRSVLKSIMGELVQTRQIDEKQAVQLVQDILFTNSKKLYDLHVETVLPTFPQLAATPCTALPQNTVLGRLRASGAKYLRIYWHDYTSSARCRFIQMKQVYKTMESGRPMTLSLARCCFGLLQTDKMIPQVNATGMYTMHPDWSTLKLGPVAGHISCYGEFRELDGSEATLCPRTILRKSIEKAAANNLTFLLGFELEFVILERNPDTSSPDRYKPLNNEGQAWSMARVLADWGSEGSFTTAIDEVLDRLEKADISIEQFHPESGTGQYELVLGALPPMEACDTLLHMRQILESVAARHGFRMTLHPKPFAKTVGSASHLHMSISSPGGNEAKVYESFYAGILKHIRAIIAITYSNPTSYERMVDSFWAGGRWVTWGTQNKEAPLRKCEDSHWELKVIDGLANPYFVVAALLAAGTDGVLNKTPMMWRDCAHDPAKLNDAERKELGISTMFPADLKEALQALKDDEELGQLLHPDFIQRYVDVKTAELGLFDSMSAEDRRSSLAATASPLLPTVIDCIFEDVTQYVVEFPASTTVIDGVVTTAPPWTTLFSTTMVTSTYVNMSACPAVVPTPIPVISSFTGLPPSTSACTIPTIVAGSQPGTTSGVVTSVVGSIPISTLISTPVSIPTSVPTSTSPGSGNATTPSAGGFVTIIPIPGAAPTTVSLIPGEVRIISLPAGLLTTISAPGGESLTAVPTFSTSSQPATKSPQSSSTQQMTSSDASSNDTMIIIPPVSPTTSPNGESTVIPPPVTGTSTSSSTGGIIILPPGGLGGGGGGGGGNPTGGPPPVTLPSDSPSGTIRPYLTGISPTMSPSSGISDTIITSPVSQTSPLPTVSATISNGTIIIFPPGCGGAGGGGAGGGGGGVVPTIPPDPPGGGGGGGGGGGVVPTIPPGPPGGGGGGGVVPTIPPGPPGGGGGGGGSGGGNPKTPPGGEPTTPPSGKDPTTAPVTGPTSPTLPSTAPTGSATCEPVDITTTGTSTSTTSTTSTPTPLCTGLSKFSRHMVTVDGVEYYVPATGDPLYIMLNDATGTEVKIAPDQVVISDAVFTVPTDPLPSPSEVTQGNYKISFRSRPLPTPSLQPANSPAGRDFALGVANDYIKFSDLMTAPVAQLFSLVFDLFARYDAPPGYDVFDFLGFEDEVLDAVQAAAANLTSMFDEKRQGAFEGFLHQISLLDGPEDEDPDPTDGPGDGGRNSCEGPDSGDAGGGDDNQPDDQPSAAKYIDTVYSGQPGIQNLCQRAPWRSEGLLNVVRFLAREDWTSRPQLLTFLKNHKSSYMSNQPQGVEGLTSGGGVLISGATAFHVVSRVDMSNTTELFGNRSWYVKTDGTRAPLWYFNSTVAFMDAGTGYTSGTDIIDQDGIDQSTGYAYLNEMDMAQGYPMAYALQNWDYLKQTPSLWFWVYLHPTYEEEAPRRALYGVEPIYDDPPEPRTQTRKRSRPLGKSANTTGLKHLQRRARIDEDLPPAFEHQLLISAREKYPMDVQMYSRDGSDGAGVTIFVIDSGFDLSGGNAQEYQIPENDFLDHPDQYSYVVPNRLTRLFNRNNQASWLREEIGDSCTYNGQFVGHGTQVGALAFGRKVGLAKNAIPFLVKAVNGYVDSDGVVKGAYLSPDAMDDALTKIEQIIVRRGLQGNAVISSSLHTDYWATPQDYEVIRAMYARHLTTLRDLGVVYVQAAGNDGYNPALPGANVNYIGWRLPGGLGDPVVNVDIWAQGYRVPTVGLGGAEATATGTSFAAPQVAWLAAYLIRMNRDAFRWQRRGRQDQGYLMVLNIRNLLMGWPYRRIPMSQQLNLPAGQQLPYPMPHDVNVAYNGIHGVQPSYPEPAALPAGGSAGQAHARIDPNDEGYFCPIDPVGRPTATLTGATTLATSTVPAASSTTPTASPAPTTYYSGPNVQGCANDECNQCADGYTQECSTAFEGVRVLLLQVEFGLY
ncbi:Uu.00g096600.m01.CDS01 [Anthostomella pinea]|uniref:Uu.00g096600.m01.CDS01 n=1 Tax=Anthostomella pinea TaxID=933095 RepID=A0AAI8VCC3_9PEZI|nr:Uu.00g096600.m01.CDS01 [Anthostomella pinea]